MLVIEKAWAKICGSYEASEGGHSKEAFLALAGGPVKTYKM